MDYTQKTNTELEGIIDSILLTLSFAPVLSDEQRESLRSELQKANDELKGRS